MKSKLGPCLHDTLSSRVGDSRHAHLCFAAEGSSSVEETPCPQQPPGAQQFPRLPVRPQSQCSFHNNRQQNSPAKCFSSEPTEASRIRKETDMLCLEDHATSHPNHCDSGRSLFSLNEENASGGFFLAFHFFIFIPEDKELSS